MAKLIVQRASAFMHKKMPYKVIVDGQEVGKLANGETIELDIAAGAHTLRTGMGKLNGQSRVEHFEIADGQTVTFSTGGARWSMIFFVLAILAGVGAGKNIGSGQILGALISIIIGLVWYFIGLQFFVRQKRIS